MLKWWRRRRLLIEDRRRVLEHTRSVSDPKDNDRLRRSYDEYPLRLAAVIVADIFIDSDIRSLWKALRRHLRPDQALRQDVTRIREFLQRAESKTGGREGLGVIHFYRPSQAKHYLMGGHEVRMPPGVERVGLVLYQFAPGMVMAATVAAASSDTAAKVFHRSHQSRIQRGPGYSLSFQPMESAKTEDLERRFRSLVEVELLPRSSGVLAGQRYPFGTVVVWTAAAPPPPDAPSWRDLGLVLGVESWHWWQGEDRRLYSGVPVAGWGLSDREGGYSMLVTRQVASEDLKEFGGLEGVVRYELEHEVDDWLPLLLLQEAALLVTDKAGRLRETLNRRATARLRAVRLLGLGSLVTRLHSCQYQLERLRQAAGFDGERGFRQFPVLVSVIDEPKSELSRPSVLLRLTHLGRKRQQKAEKAAIHLRNAAMDGLDRLTKSGLHEVGLSLDRARLLAEIRSTNVLLYWTAVVAILTAILVLREVTRR